MNDNERDALEAMISRVVKKSLGEPLTAIEQALDRLTTRTGRLEHATIALGSAVTEMELRVEKVGLAVNAIRVDNDERIEAIEQRLGAVEKKLEPQQ